MNKHKKPVWGVLLGCCCLLFLCSFLWFLYGYDTKKNALQQYESLSYSKIKPIEILETVENTEAVETMETMEIMGIMETEEVDSHQVPDLALDFAYLKEEVNDDIYAWIYIPETNVNYPILQHPTDDSYYLNHNLDDSYGYPGSIYTESLNLLDFTDPNTVLYGHNMKDGSMFHSIKNFADGDFFDKNEFIYIYSEDKTYIYEVFAAYTFSDMHLLRNYYLENDEIFQIYLDGILATRAIGANIKKEMELTFEDRIITLSTCVGQSDQRFLVQGVLVEERDVE